MESHSSRPPLVPTSLQGAVVTSGTGSGSGKDVQSMHAEHYLQHNGIAPFVRGLVTDMLEHRPSQAQCVDFLVQRIGDKLKPIPARGRAFLHIVESDPFNETKFRDAAGKAFLTFDGERNCGHAFAADYATLVDALLSAYPVADKAKLFGTIVDGEIADMVTMERALHTQSSTAAVSGRKGSTDHAKGVPAEATPRIERSVSEEQDDSSRPNSATEDAGSGRGAETNDLPRSQAGQAADGLAGEQADALNRSAFLQPAHYRPLDFQVFLWGLQAAAACYTLREAIDAAHVAAVNLRGAADVDTNTFLACLPTSLFAEEGEEGTKGVTFTATQIRSVAEKQVEEGKAVSQAHAKAVASIVAIRAVELAPPLAIRSELPWHAKSEE